MRYAKATLLVSLIVFGLAGGAFADKLDDMHGPTINVPVSPPGSSRATGDDCLDPILIDGSALPYSDLGQTTCGRLNTYSATGCMGSYDGGEDIVYELTIAAETIVDITMTSDTTWSGLGVFLGCPDLGVCVASSTSSGTDEAITGLVLPAGVYYIMVDTWPTPDCVNLFDLTVVAGTPPGPGEDCTTAVEALEELNSAPFADYWYVFTGPAEPWTLILDSCIEGQTVDTYVRVYDACAGTQLAYNDDMGSTECPGNSYASHLEVELAPSQTVYILWDDVYSSEPFDWNLNIALNGVAVEHTTWSQMKALYE